MSRSCLAGICCCLVAFFVCGGATCSRRRSAIPEFNPPQVFSHGTPSLAELVHQINRSLAIESLSSNSLTIQSPDLAYKLTGNFVWQRPHNLRLDTKLFSSAFGTPLSAGSNAEMFWMVVQRPSPAIYYAYHNEFEGQMGPRQFLPVSPLWLREAFGIIEMDPSGRHEAPVVRPDGKLQVVSYIPSQRGDYRRVIILAPGTGTIEQTILYDHQGKLIATARQSDHQYYSAIDWSLPHKVQVQMQPDVGEPITFSIEVGFYTLNESNGRQDLFVFPDTTGLATVDLTRANAMLERTTPASPSAWDTSSFGPQLYSPVAGGMPAPRNHTEGPNAPPISTSPVYRTVRGNALDEQWQRILER